MNESQATEMPLVRFAIVGCGRIARHHVAQLQEDGRGLVTVLCDVSPDQAWDLRQQTQLLSADVIPFSDLLVRDDIDAVLLCSPTREHYSQAVACLERGWHLLCEKPLATERREITDLIRRAKDAPDQVLSLGYQRRHWATFRTLHHELASGRWGRVLSVASHVFEAWQPTVTGSWRNDPVQNPGGFVGDAGSHKLDMILHVTGLLPRQVFARTWHCGSQVEMIASVSAVLENDVPCTLDFVGNAHILGEDLSIHCEHADFFLRYNHLSMADRHGLATFPIQGTDSNPVAALIDAIQCRTGSPVPFTCALPVFDFTQAILQSAASGHNVRLATN